MMPAEMELIHKVHLEKLILETKGKFFTVKFKKVDGSDRTMNCRIGVQKDLKGGVCHAQRLDTPYKVVWDLHKKAYRLINYDTIYEVHWRHKVYRVVRDDGY